VYHITAIHYLQQPLLDNKGFYGMPPLAFDSMLWFETPVVFYFAFFDVDVVSLSSSHVSTSSPQMQSVGTMIESIVFHRQR
jgi:hypothetical protein